MTIPENFAQKDLIGELVTLINSHKVNRAGLPEWELNVSWQGVPLKLRVFQELESELEKAGVSLEETPSGSNWEKNPLYFGTLGYDEKYNRLTLDAIKTPNGKFLLNLKAFNQRSERTAPELPRLARKEAPATPLPSAGLSIAQKAELIEKLAQEIQAETAAQAQANPSELLFFRSQISAAIAFSAGDIARKAGMLQSNYVPSKEENKAKPKWGGKKK